MAYKTLFDIKLHFLSLCHKKFLSNKPSSFLPHDLCHFWSFCHLEHSFPPASLPPHHTTATPKLLCRLVPYPLDLSLKDPPGNSILKCHQQPLWRTVWRFLKKLEIELPSDPAIPLLGIYTEKTRIERDTCTPMFIFSLIFKNFHNKKILKVFLSDTFCHILAFPYFRNLSFGKHSYKRTARI